MIVAETIIVVLLFSLFAFSHTWLASTKLKRKLAEKLGDRIAFYRLFYNISSIIFFITFYAVSPKPEVIIYDLRFPFDIITFALQVLSLIGLFWASRGINWKEFLGIDQIKRFINGEYNVNDLDEKQVFRIEGAFKFVRHPIYLFSILFLGFRPSMTLFYLTLYVCVIIYFYTGSIYEERKLIEMFGNEYKEYKKKVPRIFPVKIKKD